MHPCLRANSSVARTSLHVNPIRFGKYTDRRPRTLKGVKTRMTWLLMTVNVATQRSSPCSRICSFSSWARCLQSTPHIPFLQNYFKYYTYIYVSLMISSTQIIESRFFYSFLFNPPRSSPTATLHFWTVFGDNYESSSCSLSDAVFVLLPFQTLQSLW
jgi:hypothetical protein